MGLFLAADGELLEPHAPSLGIDALVLGSAPIDFFAEIARHTLAPFGHGYTVASLRRIRIAAMLGVAWRAPQGRTGCMRPLDIFVFSEAAIDQIVGRPIVACLQGLDCRARQAAI